MKIDEFLPKEERKEKEYHHNVCVKCGASWTLDKKIAHFICDLCKYD